MKARVLIIEDNPPNLELMTYLLVAFGHKVSKAENGESGLELAQSNNFDVILCDIQLPDIGGEEIARRLKNSAHTAKTTLVAVTALAMLGDRDRLLSAGFDGYISKPIDPDTFVPQVERLANISGSALVRPAVSSPASPHPAAEPQATQGKILVLDDSTEARYFFRFVLEPAGYLVEVAAHIEEAIAMSRSGQPDLIISDMHLARGEDGEQLLTRVKEDALLNKIPVLIVTSSHQPSKQTVDRVKNVGAEDLLIRPISPADLLHAIRSVLKDIGPHV